MCVHWLRGILEVLSLSQSLLEFSFLLLNNVQLCCSGICDDDDLLYEDFSMADVDLSIENYEELFGVSQNHSEQLLENGGIDSLFGIGNLPGTDASARGAYVAEVSS